MKLTWSHILLPLFFTTALPLAAEQDPRCFEMRTYFAPPGKLDELQTRFRDHTCKLFEKHGMANVGYWVPLENPESKLIYLLAYPSRDARDKSWKAFMADPDWKAASKASEANGKLVTKVESIFLNATDYSPAIKSSAKPAPRVFELRTYKTTSDKLDALNSRFRDHTVGLFSKHGITHIGYWTPMPGAKGAGETLIYILAHKSRDAAEGSFKSFRADPAWIAAKAASEKDGSLTLPQPDGVKTIFMVPTDYSPLR